MAPGEAMIYHFTTITPYAAPFVNAAADFARRFGVPITTVIIADTRDTSAFPQRDGSQSIEVPSVNSAAFRRRLSRGAAGVITGFPQIIEPATLERFRSLVNFHPSLLPYYRGPWPLQWMIANEERIGGFTVHEVTERVDDGPILYQEAIDIAGITELPALEQLVVQAQLPAFVRYLSHVAFQTPFVLRIEDAHALYRCHQRYASAYH